MKSTYFKYIFALLLFGSNGIWANLIDLNSYEIVLFRTFIGSLFLMFIFFLKKEKLTFYQYKKQFGYLTASGIATGVSWLFLYEAYQEVGVSLASLTYYCGPVIVMVLSPFLFHEKLTKAKSIRFIAVLVGIFLINGTAFHNDKNSWGLFCGSMSAICYSLMVIFHKKVKKITGLENSMLQLFISFVTVAVFVVIKQGASIHFPSETIVPMLVLGLVNTGIGCYFYFSSIGHLPVHAVAICGYLEPLSAVLFSVIFLNELLLPIQMIGAILIIGGAICGEKKGRIVN